MVPGLVATSAPVATAQGASSDTTATAERALGSISSITAPPKSSAEQANVTLAYFTLKGLGSPKNTWSGSGCRASKWSAGSTQMTQAKYGTSRTKLAANGGSVDEDLVDY